MHTTMLGTIVRELEQPSNSLICAGQPTLSSCFTLHQIRCNKTEDYLGADECLLKVYVDNAFKKKLKRKMNDGQLWRVGIDFPFDEKIVVKLWDEDWPDPDDLIGQLRLNKNSTSGTKYLRSGRANYSITYSLKHSKPGTITPGTRRKRRSTSCNRGEFLGAIRFYLQQQESATEQKKILILLCSSPSFRKRVKGLNGRVVSLHGGKRLDKHCGGSQWREKCKVNNDGVLTQGGSKGRTVIEVFTNPTGSEFLPTRAIGNLFGDRHLMVIEPPPGNFSPAKRRGWLIRRIAHETFHAYRHMSPKGRVSNTLSKRILASIDEEIDARKFDKKVVDEIRHGRWKGLIEGYVYSGSANRYIVERDPYPGELKLTYLEHHAMSALMFRAAEKEGLTKNDIESIHRELKVPDLKPFFKGRDAIRRRSKYKELRLLVLYMDKDWENRGLGGHWTTHHEATAQEHACVFRRLIKYTPHPVPAIRKPNC